MCVPVCACVCILLCVSVCVDVSGGHLHSVFLDTASPCCVLDVWACNMAAALCRLCELCCQRGVTVFLKLHAARHFWTWSEGGKRSFEDFFHYLHKCKQVWSPNKIWHKHWYSWWESKGSGKAGLTLYLRVFPALRAISQKQVCWNKKNIDIYLKIPPTAHHQTNCQLLTRLSAVVGCAIILGFGTRTACKTFSIWGHILYSVSTVHSAVGFFNVRS